MTTTARAVRGYQSAQTQTGSPLELVVLLYDGALRHVADASRAIDRHDLTTRGTAISKALAIVSELRSTLDLERGGTIATELDRLYDYVEDRLLMVTRDHDRQALNDVQRLLQSLADAWRTVAAQKASSDLPR